MSAIPRWLDGLSVISLLVVCCVSGVSGCASNPHGAPTGPGRDAGVLTVKCAPAGALLYVNDLYLGGVKAEASRPLPLPPGVYRIELRKEGYFAHYAEVRIGRGASVVVNATLRQSLF